jgi:glutamyl-tRNA reductase
MQFEMLPDESFENWSQRVRTYEQGRALMHLAQGQDPVQVMTEASRRIMNKLQHSVIESIHKSVTSTYEPVSSLEDYRRNYLERVGPKSDHIGDL